MPSAKSTGMFCRSAVWGVTPVGSLAAFVNHPG